MRHVLAAEPRRQRDALIAPLARIDLAFDRRRRRRQHDRDFCDMRAHHRHVAGVVMRAFVLLVGLVVLLIDDDEAEIGIGQEQRRAGADHDRRLALRYRRPVARRVRGVSSECHSSGRTPKRCAKRSRNWPVSAISGIRISDLLAAPDVLRDRLEIDLGLAGTGDAIEQGDVEAAVRGERPHHIDRAALLAGKIRLCKGGIRRRRRGRRRHRLDGQRALVDQAIDHAGADAGFARRLRLAVQQAVRQHLDQPPPRRRQRAAAARRPAARRGASARGRGYRPSAAPSAAPCRAPTACSWTTQSTSWRSSAFSGGTSSFSLTSLRRLCRRGSGLAFSAHTTATTSRGPSGTADHVARRKLHAARHAVGIGLVQRDRHQHIDDTRRRCGSGAAARGVVHRESDSEPDLAPLRCLSEQ